MGHTKKPLRVVSIKLPADLDDALTALATARQATRSLVVREALAHYAKIPMVSVVSAAGALVGCLEGPSDLATNAKHMKGYGE